MQMEAPGPNTSRGYFFTLTLLHAAICIAVAVAGGLFYWLRYSGEASGTDPELESTFTILVPLLLALAGFASLFLFNRRIGRIRDIQKLSDKLTAFRTLHIFRLVMLELAAIIGLIAYFLCGQSFFLLASAAAWVYMLSMWPTRQKVYTVLALDYQDRSILDDPQAEIP